MAAANPKVYLKEIAESLKKHWPDNRIINVVCHGHSVPSGYFATPFVNTFHAYPHLLHQLVKERFPFAVMNVIVTAVGGEHSESGAERLEKEALCHRPEVLLIDYGLNDRSIGLKKAEKAWRSMIEKALDNNVRVILLTPTWENTDSDDEAWQQLYNHAEQIRSLSNEYKIGLADSFAAFQSYALSNAISDLLSWHNHPNGKGHQMVAELLLRWFM